MISVTPVESALWLPSPTGWEDVAGLLCPSHESIGMGVESPDGHGCSHRVETIIPHIILKRCSMARTSARRATAMCT